MEAKLKVLVVEDDSVISIDIARVVKQAGHHVIGIAAKYEQAVMLAGEQALDLVICDIHLKHDQLDGIDVAKVLQERYGVPVIFITAFKDDNTIERASAISCIGYLTKPFRPYELEILIKMEEKRQGKCSRHTKKLSNGYHYNQQNQKLYHRHKEIQLSDKERLLIGLLIRNHGELVSYEQIDMALWPLNTVGESTRRQFLFRLRQKVADLDLHIVKKYGWILN